MLKNVSTHSQTATLFAESPSNKRTFVVMIYCFYFIARFSATFVLLRSKSTIHSSMESIDVDL